MEVGEKQDDNAEVTSETVVPVVMSNETALAVKASKTTATAFLERNGLGQLVEAFRVAGFESKEDVVCLTPRRYEVVGGVEKIGTKIRLQRVIEQELEERRQERIKRDHLHSSRARVRIQGRIVEFCMPPGSNVGDLCVAIERQTGLRASSFYVAGQRAEGDDKVRTLSSKARVSLAHFPKKQDALTSTPQATDAAILTFSEDLALVKVNALLEHEGMRFLELHGVGGSGRHRLLFEDGEHSARHVVHKIKDQLDSAPSRASGSSIELEDEDDIFQNLHSEDDGTPYLGGFCHGALAIARILIYGLAPRLSASNRKPLIKNKNFNLEAAVMVEDPLDMPKDAIASEGVLEAKGDDHGEHTEGRDKEEDDNEDIEQHHEQPQHQLGQEPTRHLPSSKSTEASSSIQQEIEIGPRSKRGTKRLEQEKGEIRVQGAALSDMSTFERDLSLELSGNIEMVARFVPTMLVRHYIDKARRDVTSDMLVPRAAFSEQLTAALLFIDISGFTPLSAKLGALGAIGIERLSRILNDYFGRQIALVNAHGGDILKFAGDALMAMWRENMSDTRPLSCLRAAQCAIELQEKLGRSRTEDLGRSSSDDSRSSFMKENKKPELNIKISLGYGQVTAFHVGGERSRYEFFLSGKPLVQVTLAEHQARPGDVILSNESWKMVMNSCEGSVLSSGDVKLLSINNPIPVRQAPPLKLDPRIEAALSSYIPSAILSKMVSREA